MCGLRNVEVRWKMAPPLGYPKTKNFQLQLASLHWPPDQGLGPKNVSTILQDYAIARVGLHLLLVPHQNCMRQKVHMTPFQLAKMKKNRRFQGWFFENLSGGIAPDPHTRQGLRRPSPDSTPSALRRFAPPRLAWDLRSLYRPAFPQLQICHYTIATIVTVKDE